MADIKYISEYFEKIEGKITLGLDGFVDEVWQVLAKRNSHTDYILFDKMQDFAKSVYDAGKGGYANEIIRKRRVYGGCVCNTGKAAGKLGCSLTMIGMFGKPALDPVFKEFQETYSLTSIADPAICQIFEFTDGKLMFPYVAETFDLNWQFLSNALPKEDLAAIMDADIVSIGYWSQLPAFDELITGLCENFLIKNRCRRIFFDFADIRKRTQESLEQTLKVLAKYNEKLPMTLSLNEHEANLLFSYMGKNFDWKNPGAVEEHIEYVRKKAGLDELIAHTPYFAAAATAGEGTATVMQRYCEDPIITTGAGDNFNGGYLAACLGENKLNLAQRLFVGNATTGFYIRNGYSPDKTDLIGEMERMADYV